MFDFIRRHIKLLQFVLVLLIFPSFVFFGIEGYSRFTRAPPRCRRPRSTAGRSRRPNGTPPISQQLERMRRQMPNVDSSALDTPQMKRATLDSLVRENVLLAAAAQAEPRHLGRAAAAPLRRRSAARTFCASPTAA